MKTKKYLLIIFICSTFLAMTTFCSETPELGYWQRFKNWISGTPSQAQEMAKIPYEWAKNFLSGFSEKEKIALAFALGVMSANDTLNRKHLTVAGKAVGAGMIGKQVVVSIMDYIDKYRYANNLNATIASIKKDLSDSLKFPTTQSKIIALEQMLDSFEPTGDKPNPIAWQAAYNLLNAEQLKLGKTDWYQKRSKFKFIAKHLWK